MYQLDLQVDDSDSEDEQIPKKKKKWKCDKCFNKNQVDMSNIKSGFCQREGCTRKNQTLLDLIKRNNANQEQEILSWNSKYKKRITKYVQPVKRVGFF